MDCTNNFLSWTTFIIACLGALAWFQPIISSWFKRSELFLKILSNDANNLKILNRNNVQKIYVQKISIYSKNKDFSLKDIKVKIKYPDIKDELNTTLWTWNNLAFEFLENGSIIKKKLKINSNDYLIHKVLFPKNSSTVGYISFSVDYTKDVMFEYIRFEFTNFNNKTITVIVYGKDIDGNMLIHDTDIWVNQ